MPLSISLDCNHLDVQTQFWTAALGYQIVERAAQHVSLGSRDGSGPLLCLNLVPEPKRADVKNRMHLDWDVDDMETEATRLEQLGAQRLHRGSLPNCEWITMQDPEGNEFCVEQIVTTPG